MMKKGNDYSKNYLDIQTQWQVLARNDYEFYIEYVHQGLYRHGEHTKLICKKLEEIEKGKTKRLMIFLPPRHSKSMTVSETFPSWYMGKNKNRRVILVSYGGDLARKFGRINKLKLMEYGKGIFDLDIARGNSSSTNWGVANYRGGMVSTGIGGAITGEGADLLIIDDIIKNRKEANSKTYRDNAWDEWKNTLLTRLQPNGAIILIMTRWHEDDLAGRLLNPEYGEVDEWDIINLPALAEENDLLGRKEGQPLWPEYGFDLEWAKDTKIAVGSQTWASLFQQRPSPQVGSIVLRHWWNYYDKVPDKFDEVIQSWDLSLKDTAEGSYTVGQVWGRIGANKYLLDQTRERIGFTETIKAIRNLSNKHPEAKLKLIEDKANGPAVISTLRNEIAGIIPINPRGDKVERANAVAPDIEAGNVFLPNKALAPWISDFVEEWTTFPNSATDDQVDTTTQALDRLNKRKTRENYSGRGGRYN